MEARIDVLLGRDALEMIETLLGDCLHFLEETKMLDDLFEPLVHVMIWVKELKNLVDFEAADWQHASVMILNQRPLADLPQVMIGLDNFWARLALVLRFEPLTCLSQLLKR